MAGVDVRAESQLRTGTTVSTNLSIPVADDLTKLNFAGMVGVRGRVRIAESDFYVPFQFDIGSGAAVWSWQAQVGIGYRTRWADLSAGYRYLSFQDSRNAVLQTLSMGGPFLAATFGF